MSYRYIVVEGAIGCGKSALSNRLAEYFGALHLTEGAEHNPFLEAFYSNLITNGLASELYFLNRRAEAMDAINVEEAKGSSIVADFLLEKDQIFVPVSLNHAEQTLFWETKRRVLPQYAVPDVVIYLQTSREQDLKRLQKRYQTNIIPVGYLEQIQNEYRRFFHLYDTAPLLIVNADGMDFAQNDEHFNLLIQALAEMKGSRQYLNLSVK